MLSRTHWQESHKMALKQRNYPTVPQFVGDAIQARKMELASVGKLKGYVVPGGGIEPSTHGFSVRCSTD